MQKNCSSNSSCFGNLAGDQEPWGPWPYTEVQRAGQGKTEAVAESIPASVYSPS